MKLEKVNAYMAQRLETYKSCYPAEIFEGLTFEASGGSFGHILISLENKYATVSSAYVSNYSAIDGKISEFIIRSYQNMAEKVYREEQEENNKGLYCKLEIFNNNKIVNVIEFKTARAVKSELVKIIIAEKRRGTRTTWKPIPYSNDMTVIEKWTREEAHTTTNIKYVYHFKNLDY